MSGESLPVARSVSEGLRVPPLENTGHSTWQDRGFPPGAVGRPLCSPGLHPMRPAALILLQAISRFFGFAIQFAGCGNRFKEQGEFARPNSGSPGFGSSGFASNRPIPFNSGSAAGVPPVQEFRRKSSQKN